MYKEILTKILAEQESHVFFPNMELTAGEIVETACYKALREIRDVIRDESLSDSECFMRIEKIVCILENAGIGCGGRHDF